MEVLDKNITKQIISQNWEFEVSRRFNWFVEYTQILTSSVSQQQKHLGFSVPTDNLLILNGDEYYLKDDLETYYEKFRNLEEADSNFFSKFARQEFAIVDKVKQYQTKLKNTEFSNFNNNQLIAELDKFFENYCESFVPAWTRPDMYLENRLRGKLKQLLQDENKVSEVFSKLATHPTDKGSLAYTDEPLHLLEIAKQIKNSNHKFNNLPSDITQQIDNHIQNYAWMKGSIFYEDLTFTRQEYLDRLVNLLNKDIEGQIKHIIQTRKQVDDDYQNAIGNYQIKGSFLRLAEAVRNFVFLRTYTTEASDQLFYIGRHTILREIANRLGIKPEQATMLTPDELKEGLKKHSDSTKDTIAKRTQGFAIIRVKEKTITLFGEDVNELQELVAQKFRDKSKQKTNSATVVKGMVASTGQAQGRVRILHSHHDVDKLKPNEILVASMTTPDYVMAMEKAAAFVTDEGGITCHAAIVAREFGVPCIVGTGNATRLLQDGDLVEVDAKKGIVRKIR